MTRDGVLAPEECSYQTIPSCSLGSVRGQFWQVAVITLITRLLLIKKLSLKDDTMTLARHSLLPGPLLRCYAWQLFSGYTVWWHSHTSTQLHEWRHPSTRWLEPRDTASCCIVSPCSITLKIAAPSPVKTALSHLSVLGPGVGCRGCCGYMWPGNLSRGTRRIRGE